MRSGKSIIKFFANSVFLTCVVLILPLLSIAQHYNFRSYSVEDGLGQSQVYSICQGLKGNLWVGTYAGGVSKYDGVTFTTFTVKEGLADNTVASIIQDKKGVLWFGTYGGVSRYDGKTFINYTEKDGLCNNQVNKIIEDKDGNLWIGTGGGGLSRFDGKTFVNFTEKEGLSSNIIWSIIQDHAGYIWIATGKGLHRYDGKKFQDFSKTPGLLGTEFRSLCEDHAHRIWVASNKGINCLDGEKCISYTMNDGLVFNNLWSITEDRAGHIWLGTTGGLSQFDGKNFINYTTEQGISNNTVWCITEDREGNLWFGTNGGGIVKYARRCFVSFSEAEGLTSGIVNAIYKDRQGNYWYGTTSGLSKYDGKKYVSFLEKDGLANKKVWSAFQDKKGNMWFGTYNGVSIYNGKSFQNYSEKDGIPRNAVYSINDDKQGNIWMGTNGGLAMFDGRSFHAFRKEDGFLSDFVRFVFRDSKGTMWLATDDGVVRFNPDSNQLHPYFINITEKDGLINKKVFTIGEDNVGNIWFGTNEGMHVYGPVPGTNIRAIKDTISIEDGLSADGVILLKSDAYNNLWIGTGKGISKLNLAAYNKNKSKVFKHYNKSDGFSGVECNQNAVFEEEGHMWFGTIKGAIRYTLAEDKTNTVAPVTHINDIRLFYEKADLQPFSDGIDSTTNLPVNLDLTYKMNHVTFDYVGVSLTAPENVRYQYFLEGLDHDWSPVTKETHVTYPNLSPGDYVFRVKACNNDGIWNSEARSFAFSITPPIWLRSWFIITCIIVGVAAIYIAIQLRLRNLVKQRQILERKVEMRTKELKEEKEKVEEINQEVIHQKEIIELKNKDITDSIHYAKRIQEAILPTKSLILKALPDSFVLFRPKDIVSGDFYWFAAYKEKVLIAAVDCTGHGVPGAFMSMIGNTLLNEIVLEKGIVKPSDILNNLHDGVRQSLKQNLDDAETNDGMDVALCAIDTVKGELEFAAAYRPLYHVCDGKLSEYKGDKFAIGGSHIEEKRIFTNNIIPFSKGDTFYLFTDGYADQFGGPDGKKFLSKRFQELLLSVENLSMAEREKILDKRITEWRGREEQVDDILVIGIRL